MKTLLATLLIIAVSLCIANEPTIEDNTRLYLTEGNYKANDIIFIIGPITNETCYVNTSQKLLACVLFLGDRLVNKTVYIDGTYGYKDLYAVKVVCNHELCHIYRTFEEAYCLDINNYQEYQECNMLIDNIKYVRR